MRGQSQGSAVQSRTRHTSIPTTGKQTGLHIYSRLPRNPPLPLYSHGTPTAFASVRGAPRTPPPPATHAHMNGSPPMVAAVAQGLAAATVVAVAQGPAAAQGLVTAAAQDLAATQGLGPAVAACLCVVKGACKATWRRRARRRPRSGPVRRLRPAGVRLAVCATEHSVARGGGKDVLLYGLLPNVLVLDSGTRLGTWWAVPYEPTPTTYV